MLDAFPISQQKSRNALIFQEQMAGFFQQNFLGAKKNDMDCVCLVA
jgi:hypothetical protein